MRGLFPLRDCVFPGGEVSPGGEIVYLSLEVSISLESISLEIVYSGAVSGVRCSSHSALLPGAGAGLSSGTTSLAIDLVCRISGI